MNLAINYLRGANENFSAAESQIRDMDVCEEAANLTRVNILQEAGLSVLTPPNKRPELALSLLG